MLEHCGLGVVNTRLGYRGLSPEPQVDASALELMFCHLDLNSALFRLENLTMFSVPHLSVFVRNYSRWRFGRLEWVRQHLRRWPTV